MGVTRVMGIPLSQLGFHWNHRMQVWQHRAASSAPALGLTRARNIQPSTRRISRNGVPTMRRNRRRLPVPQHEFPFMPGTFNLVVANWTDGDRIAREQAEADRARHAAESQQAALFIATRNED